MTDKTRVFKYLEWLKEISEGQDDALAALDDIETALKSCDSEVGVKFIELALMARCNWIAAEAMAMKALKDSVGGNNETT